MAWNQDGLSWSMKMRNSVLLQSISILLLDSLASKRTTGNIIHVIRLGKTSYSNTRKIGVLVADRPHGPICWYVLKKYIFFFIDPFPFIRWHYNYKNGIGTGCRKELNLRLNEVHCRYRGRTCSLKRSVALLNIMNVFALNIFRPWCEHLVSNPSKSNLKNYILDIVFDINTFRKPQKK